MTLPTEREKGLMLVAIVDCMAGLTGMRPPAESEQIPPKMRPHIDRLMFEMWRIARESVPSATLHNNDARLVWLEAMFKACPHAEIVYNDDPVDDNPVGFTILVQGCTRMEVTAPTLADAIALAMKTEPDADGNVIAISSPDGGKQING